MKLPQFRIDPLRAAEAAPSVIFLLFWRSGQDAQMSGWVGCGLAAALIITFLVRRLRFHPIMLGINVHLLLAAPLITATFEFAGAEAGRFLVEYAETGVLVMVFLTGAALTLFTRGGFLGEPEVAWRYNWRLSLLMLICLAGMIPLSIRAAHLPVVGVAGPLIVMFLLRNYLAGLAPRGDDTEQTP